MHFVTPYVPDFSIDDIARVYMVGIRGVGMAALARILLDLKLSVRGADVAESFVTDSMLEGIVVDDITTTTLPDDIDLLVYSAAHQGKENALVREAKKRGVRLATLAQMVGWLSRRQATIAVSGVGGKSTTTSMISWILECAEKRPSFYVGVGSVPNLGVSGRWQSDGEYFVVEADEYVADTKDELTPKLWFLKPTHAICTSLSFDHPDVYGSFDDTKAVFARFFANLPEQGMLVYDGDEPALRRLVAEGSGRLKNTVGVGLASHNEVVLSDFRVEKGVGTLRVGRFGEISLNVPGFHNLRNAAMAAVLTHQLGVEWETIQSALARFRTTPRRFEFKGETQNGVLCYDDYAHHPRELTAIAETLRSWFADFSITVAFQPHTFSRTKALRNEFVDALAKMPGKVLLLPIFASAREAYDDSITSEMLVADLHKRGINAETVKSPENLLQSVQTKPDDQALFITLGAGDVYKVYDHVTFRTLPS